MYSLVQVLEADGHPTSDLPEAVRARAELLENSAGFVTLLAINGDDGALVIVEIFETQDDMTAARAGAGADAPRAHASDRLEPGRTITGEIVFQRGL